MRTELIAVGLSGIILLSLVTFASPSNAVTAKLTGPDKVTEQEEVAFLATIQKSKDVTVEKYSMEFVTRTGKSVRVTFGPKGKIKKFKPKRGVVGDRGINVAKLRRSLEITRVKKQPDQAGYGKKNPRHVRFRVEFRTNAFVPKSASSHRGRPKCRIHATTAAGEQFSSNTKKFRVRNADDN